MKTVAQDFGSANNDHIFLNVFVPYSLVPQVNTHVSAEHIHGLIQISLQNMVLLENELDRVNQKEGDSLSHFVRPILKFLGENVSQEQ